MVVYLVKFSSFVYLAWGTMSVRMPNVLSTAPPAVPVLMAPHPDWIRHLETREILSASAEGYWVFGDG